ncbi:uncharacterized protein LOC128755284 isoform X2 [Synchiropus splendidus]|nr:uncharacterized protein LOC128755284 isoform X2 [Synchiropus splendidus]XP_053714487.1 uncharacterized protein LOC128755284 isoform X2 [Synchiropus splendidus]
MTVEWMWKLNDLELVVLTVRNGEELVRDKDSKYANRSSALEDGKLKLIGVTRQDAGHYRCIRRSESARKELLVHVTICESSAVDMGVLRSAENDLFVICVSTGWIPKTRISLLNRHGGVLTDKMEEGIGPDGCQSVSVSLNLTTQESFRNGTIICSVASPGSTLVKTNKMAFTDKFKLDKLQTSGSDLFMKVMKVCAIVVALALFIVWVLRRIPFDYQLGFSALMIRMGLLEDAADEERERLLAGYEDIHDIPTTGASLETAMLKGLCTREQPWSGVPVSERLAELDLQEMEQFKEDILDVGKDLKVAPCLIAGIISRQSNAGTQLRANGFGLGDENCYGLMQVNRYYQAVSGEPRSRDHIRQGVTFFIQLLKTMWRVRPKWNREQWLKGALASYIIGEDKVLSLKPSENVDRDTPCGDFANDVIARAHFYARNGFLNTRHLPI